MKKLIIAILLGMICKVGVCDTKISALPSTTTLNSVDIIPVVTNPGTSPANYTITKENLISTLGIGNSVLASSGIAFGSSNNTVTSDTNTFTYNDLVDKTANSLVLVSSPAYGFYPDPDIIHLRNMNSSRMCMGFELNGDSLSSLPLTLCRSGSGASSELMIGQKGLTGGILSAFEFFPAASSPYAYAPSLSIGSSNFVPAGSGTLYTTNQAIILGSATVSGADGLRVENTASLGSLIVTNAGSGQKAVIQSSVKPYLIIDENQTNSPQGEIDFTTLLSTNVAMIDDSTGFHIQTSTQTNAATITDRLVIVRGTTPSVQIPTGTVTVTQLPSALVATDSSGIFISTTVSLAASNIGGTLPVAKGGTGTGSTLTGLVRGGASSYSASELSGAVTTSGSNVTTAAALQSTIKTLSASSVTVTNTLLAGNVTTSSAAVGSLNSPGVFVTANYTATSTTTVILASPSNAGLTVTLPSALINGQFITVTKVDSSSGTVTIKAAGSDHLFNGSATQSILYAQGQSQVLVSSAASWNSVGPIAYTPNYLGDTSDTTLAGSVSASNAAWLCPMEVPVPVRMTGIRYQVAVQSGNIDVGVYSLSGNTLTRLASAGSTSCPAAGEATTNFTSPINLIPGQGPYFKAIAADNTTATFNLASSIGYRCRGYTSSFALPSSITYSGSAATGTHFSLQGILSGGL